MNNENLKGRSNRIYWQGNGKKGREENRCRGGLLCAPAGNGPKGIGKGGGNYGGERSGGKIPHGKERRTGPGVQANPNGRLVNRYVEG